jgi:hypothetical protein
VTSIYPHKQHKLKGGVVILTWSAILGLGVRVGVGVRVRVRVRVRVCHLYLHDE